MELEYIDRDDYKEELQFALAFINFLQNELRDDDITFQPKYIGSKKTNLILQKQNNNYFDFDINLELGSNTYNWEDGKRIFNTIYNSIANSVSNKESTNFQIKKTIGKGGIIKLEIYKNYRIYLYIDLAITKINEKNNISILRNEQWYDRNQKLKKIKGKVNRIKNERRWNDLRDHYKELKIDNYYSDKPLPSYIIYIQAVNNLINHMNQN